ncbi:RNA polymerase sigma factor [Spirosoma montaniterrae]|uniref:RNA polymerase sigma factor n=1 Tax=Spirosoma montaniterrae TaxID=1178516 RepID=UPI0009F9F918|nr:sigma-70 family RNA polymerase sigma factor [Spirosoma montaniterrae]
MRTQQQLLDENNQLIQLWHKVQAGDRDAFCQLAESQYRPLFRYATNFSDDRDLIKDAIQEVLLHIWERRNSLTIQVVSVYLFKSLRNQLLQEFRRPVHPVASLQTADISDLTDWETVETAIEQREGDTENQQKVQQAIALLPKRQQEVVFLRFYKGLENEQIAKVMDMNRQSVANLLFRALRSLKSQMAMCLGWLIVCSSRLLCVYLLFSPSLPAGLR